MDITAVLSNVHEDIITDITYDFYGKRLAACSSDLTISVWDCDDEKKWKKTSTASGDEFYFKY